MSPGGLNLLLLIDNSFETRTCSEMSLCDIVATGAA